MGKASAARVRDFLGEGVEKAMVEAAVSSALVFDADGAQIGPRMLKQKIAAQREERRRATRGGKSVIGEEAARRTNHVPETPTPERERRGDYEVVRAAPDVEGKASDRLAVTDLASTTIRRLQRDGRIDADLARAAERYFADAYAAGAVGRGGVSFGDRVDGGATVGVDARLSAVAGEQITSFGGGAGRTASARFRFEKAQACMAAVFPALPGIVDAVVLIGETLETAGGRDGVHRQLKCASARVGGLLEVGLTALAKHYGFGDRGKCACVVERSEQAG